MSRNPQVFEVGYAFLEDLGTSPGELDRLSKISAGLQEVVASSDGQLFGVSVGLNSRINTGLFQCMSFASHSPVEFAPVRMEGNFIPENYIGTSFFGLVIGFHKVHGSSLQKVDNAIFKRTEQMTTDLGLPDFYSGSFFRTALEKRYARFVIPLVEAKGAVLADFHNEYDAIVTPDRYGSARGHHAFVKEELGL